MKVRWGAALLPGLAFAALTMASSEVIAQCTVADCPSGSTIDTTPPYLGTNGADCFIGTVNDDAMFGLGGDDYLCGGGGNDLIVGGDGDDVIQGEDGDDNLQGQVGSDIIFGGLGSDTLDGGDGDDFLIGEAGADILRGGLGADFISGGDDNDILEGGDGPDSLYGDSGNDQLDGQGGDDLILDGGDGEDTINGGPGNDSANGGPGLDFISGGPDNDTLSGGDGPDLINGDDGDDVINGNADNDTLDGGAGINLLYGNSGYDVCLNAANMDLSCELFTHATLESLSAFEHDGAVVVRWITSSETGTVGFHLYGERNGEWEPLHEGLLPGLLDAPQGGVYDFRDDGADPSAVQRYRLVEVDVHGAQSTYGPFDVIPASRGESLLERGSRYAREAHSGVALGRSLKAAGSEKQRPGDPVALYLGVRETGLYAISATEIAVRLGLDEASVRDRIRAGHLLLTEQGEPVAWHGSPDGSELSFFGMERESLYTTQRIYRLSLDTGITMAERSAAPGAITRGLVFEDSRHLEENKIPGVLVAQDPDHDYWFWQLISAAPSMQQAAVVTFDLEAVMGDGTLRVDLHGITDEAHSVNVRVNGALVGATQFEGVVPHQATFPLSQAALHEGENTISIEPSNPGDSIVYLDSADVSYTRGYTTSAASLLFGASQDASVEVAGLTGDDIELLDVSEPRHPVRLTGAVTTPTGFQLSVRSEGEYLGLAAAEILAPSSVWNDIPSDLHNRANGADHLIIAPAELFEKAQELADHRKAEGLVSMVVELQDIYDEFAFGTPDPNAIRTFLGYANGKWATAPQFVVLVGKGSLDYRDLQGLGGNLLPPIMAPTHGGFLSSDTKYADFLGNDGLPDVSIGRLPVTTVSELDSVIQQIVTYEDSIDSLTKDIVLLADANSPQGNFTTASDEMSKVLPADWSIAPVYRSELGDLETTRALFFDEVRRGPRLVSYLGHAGITSLGLTEKIFSVDDLDTMAIDGAQPVFAAMTCVVSRFEVPGLVSLGEAMLIDDQGAIAVWGPSGVSINEQATLLGGELLKVLSSGTETRLGPMINRAYPVLADLEFGRDMVEIYQLFGDPALRVVKGADGTGTGGSGGVAGAGGRGGSSDGGDSDLSQDNLTTAGCVVGPSGKGNASPLLLLLGLLTFAWRRRRTN